MKYIYSGYTIYIECIHVFQLGAYVMIRIHVLEMGVYAMRCICSGLCPASTTPACQRSDILSGLERHEVKSKKTSRKPKKPEKPEKPKHANGLPQ